MDAEGGCVGGSGPGQLVVKLTSLGHLHFRSALAPPGGKKQSSQNNAVILAPAAVCVCERGDKFSGGGGGGRANGSGLKNA